MLYPMKFDDIYKGMPKYIWGGRNLAAIGKRLPNEGTVAESWEVSCNPAGLSVISNGEYKGVELVSVVEELGGGIVGNAKVFANLKRFPLLVKFIDANEDLSIQVHPGDEYAQSAENEEFGKNEMWYVVAANQGASLIYDIKPGTTREEFSRKVDENSVLDCLQTVYVSPGDVVNIPAGLVHAIGKGIVLAEIQQNSDLTYRVFDYDRTGPDGKLRPLHIKKALDVIDFGPSAGLRKEKYTGLSLEPEMGNLRTIVVANKYFAIEKFDISKKHEAICNGERFYILTAISGKAELKYEDGSIGFKSGESMLLPACLGVYSIDGNVTYLKSYVPDIEADILNTLVNAGYSMSEIAENIGGVGSQV